MPWLGSMPILQPKDVKTVVGLTDDIRGIMADYEVSARTMFALTLSKIAQGLLLQQYTY